uniref:Uncharacterized protein n=1 Tax=Macrostomum lignano TaxID=282301 RepID=A0A1I8F6D5_9PLAT
MHGLSSTAYCLQPAFPLGKAKFIPSTLRQGFQRSGAPKRSSSSPSGALKLTEPFERTFSVPLPVQVVKNASDYQITLALVPGGCSHGVHSPDAVHEHHHRDGLQEAWGSSSELLGAGGDSSSKWGVGSESAKSDSPWIHWRSVLTINSLNSPFAFDRNAFPPELQHLVKTPTCQSSQPAGCHSKRPTCVQVNSTDTRALLTLRFEAREHRAASPPADPGTLRRIVEKLRLRDTDIDDVKAIFNRHQFLPAAADHLRVRLSPGLSISWLSKMISHSGARWTAVWASPALPCCGAASAAWWCLLYLAEEKTSLLVVAPAACAARHRTVEIVQVFK